MIYNLSKSRDMTFQTMQYDGENFPLQTGHMYDRHSVFKDLEYGQSIVDNVEDGTSIYAAQRIRPTGDITAIGFVLQGYSLVDVNLKICLTKGALEGHPGTWDCVAYGEIAPGVVPSGETDIVWAVLDTPVEITPGDTLYLGFYCENGWSYNLMDVSGGGGGYYYYVYYGQPMGWSSYYGNDWTYFSWKAGTPTCADGNHPRLCSLYGCYYWNDECHDSLPSSCDELEENYCDGSVLPECQYWYDDSCHSDPPPLCGEVYTKGECDAIPECCWYNDLCNEQPASNCEELDEVSCGDTKCMPECEYWWGDSCHDYIQPCDQLTNPDCDTREDCCYWNDTCHDASPSGCSVLTREYCEGNVKCAEGCQYWWDNTCHIDLPEHCGQLPEQDCRGNVLPECQYWWDDYCRDYEEPLLMQFTSIPYEEDVVPELPEDMIYEHYNPLPLHQIGPFPCESVYNNQWGKRTIKIRFTARADNITGLGFVASRGYQPTTGRVRVTLKEEEHIIARGWADETLIPGPPEGYGDPYWIQAVFDTPIELVPFLQYELIISSDYDEGVDWLYQICYTKDEYPFADFTWGEGQQGQDGKFYTLQTAPSSSTPNWFLISSGILGLWALALLATRGKK